MKQEASFFDNREPVLIYIAKKLRDATRLESVLTEAGVDYGVEADEYRGGVVFASTRIGAFFYVLPESRAGRAGNHGTRRLQASLRARARKGPGSVGVPAARELRFRESRIGT
jgi:hypothetical protein